MPLPSVTDDRTSVAGQSIITEWTREGSSPFDPLIRERELEGQESISSTAAAAVFITTSILLFEPKDEKKGVGDSRLYGPLQYSIVRVTSS